MTEFFHVGSRGQTIRAVLWGGLLLAGWMVAWGAELVRSLGSDPGDGGLLLPLGERLLTGGIVAGVGVALAIGLVVWARLYVLRAWLDTGGNQVVLQRSLPGLPPLRIPLGQMGGTRYAPGRSSKADAPWLAVQIRGRRLPLIFDARGEIVDPGAAQRALGPEWIRIKGNP